MAVKAAPKTTTRPVPKAKTTAAKPAASPKSPAPAKTNSAPKSEPAAPKDTFTKAAKETGSEDKGRFSSFLDNVKGSFGQLGASTQPLEFDESEKKDGLKAADTMGRLAGTDSTWDRSDLANNLAQLQTSGGFRGRIESSVAQGKLFETHQVPEEERQGIVDQSRRLKEENPHISKLHKLEGMDPSKITDPEKRAQYDQLRSQWTSDLSEKGLLPVGIPQMRSMGDASENLQEQMKERGLPIPDKGKPIDVEQFRGLFEGKSPLRTAIGF